MGVTVSLEDLTGQLEQLEAEAAAEIAAAATAPELEALRVGLLGKKGRLSAVLG
ncbi:MAG: phenylalanine--tRNA ligase subunit alpha, partial [Cyanobium sp.]